MPRYQRPDWGTKYVFNPAVAALTRLGISIYGSRILRVQGRKTGEWRSVPANPLNLGDRRYLVAPRGHTQWVRNLRASGQGELVLGRRVERFTANEIPDEEKAPILRAYLKRWFFEVGQFFDGIDANAPKSELVRIAPDHPIFRIEPI